MLDFLVLPAYLGIYFGQGYILNSHHNSRQELAIAHVIADVIRQQFPYSNLVLRQLFLLWPALTKFNLWILPNFLPFFSIYPWIPWNLSIKINIYWYLQLLQLSALILATKKYNIYFTSFSYRILIIDNKMFLKNNFNIYFFQTL